ncbi:MAG: thioesterase family protein [Hyphomicrobiaceae bacterium]
MNLWLRLIWFALTAWRRPALRDANEASVLRFRVWPNDLDLSLHMNNGRYLTLMDLGRMDLMVRMGLWRAVRRHKWTPIASSIIVRYRRELMPFARFRLETRMVSWGEASVVIEQVFVLTSGPHQGQVAARALFKGGIYSRAERKFVNIYRLMAEIGQTAESPVPTAEVESFVKADGALKMTAAGYSAEAANEI